MKVGSMSRDWAVGGMKGVCVGAGEQAEVEIRVNEMRSRLALSLIEGCRLGKMRGYIHV